MNIIILDDYQDAVRKLRCAQLLEPYNAKVYTNTVKGTGQLGVRLRDAHRQPLAHPRRRRLARWQVDRGCGRTIGRRHARGRRTGGQHENERACGRPQGIQRRAG